MEQDEWMTGWRCCEMENVWWCQFFKSSAFEIFLVTWIIFLVNGEKTPTIAFSSHLKWLDRYLESLKNLC